MLDEASRQWLAQLQQQDGPAFESLTIDALRAAMDAMAATDSPGPAIARVADFTASLPHTDVPVRLYHRSPENGCRCWSTITAAAGFPGA
ncbi:MAG: hypothetical protein HC872_08525 [Gammaproteobacteria bacterium]|nr:hypothetical protein [Gammaproteobacteria bacterium]